MRIINCDIIGFFGILGIYVYKLKNIKHSSIMCKTVEGEDIQEIYRL